MRKCKDRERKTFYNIIVWLAVSQHYRRNVVLYVRMFRQPGGAVSIATNRWFEIEQFCFDSRHGRRFFSSPKSPGRLWDENSLLFEMLLANKHMMWLSTAWTDLLHADGRRHVTALSSGYFRIFYTILLGSHIMRFFNLRKVVSPTQLSSFVFLR
jgi:hypothetical protein